jgi:hypothetical protein
LKRKNRRNREYHHIEAKEYLFKKEKSYRLHKISPMNMIRITMLKKKKTLSLEGNGAPRSVTVIS